MQRTGRQRLCGGLFCPGRSTGRDSRRYHPAPEDLYQPMETVLEYPAIVQTLATGALRCDSSGGSGTASTGDFVEMDDPLGGDFRCPRRLCGFHQTQALSPWFCFSSVFAGDQAIVVDQRKNAKRIKQGKLPMYETRRLVIKAPITRGAASQAQGDSDRQGPREHLRRGHIRRLQDGRRIWVQSCVVGSRENGVIHKSYAVVGVKEAA